MSWRAAVDRVAAEVRFIACHSEASVGLRKFVSNQHAELRMLNPAVPLLVREGADIVPHVVVQYGDGQEARADVAGLGESEVAGALEQLVKGGMDTPAMQALQRQLTPPVVDA